MTTNDNELYSERQRVVQQMTSSDEIQKMTMSDTEWQRVIQRMRTIESK